MQNGNYILAIDLGTSGPKVALYNNHAQLIDFCFEKNKVQLLPNGGAQQDPHEWWSTIKTAYFALLQKTGINPAQIGFVGVTGQWSGTVAVDASGKPLMPAIIWMDSRGHAEIANLYKGPLKIQGYGLRKALDWMRICNGIAGKSGKDPLAHILYLKKEHPEIYRNTHKFLEPIDYLTYRFTGKMVASYHTITLHWLTDNRNIHHIKYHEPFLKAAGIDRKKLPNLVPAGGIIGTVCEEAARELQLSPSVQVITASGDVMSAAVGSGAIQDAEPHVYIGTSGWLVCHLPDKMIDIRANMATLPSAMPGVFLLTNEQENAGNCLNFLRDNLLYPADAFNSGEPPPDFYERINAAADSVPPGSEGLIFFPWLYGERSPADDHTLRGGFFNMGLHHRRPHMVRAILEGVCYNARWLFENVQRCAKTKFEHINIIGGGAQSHLWCQIMADVLQCRVQKVRNPIMANTQGVAYLCLMAQGQTDRNRIAALNFIEKDFLPNANNAATYNRLYNAFVTFYKQNKALFAQLNG